MTLQAGIRDTVYIYIYIYTEEKEDVIVIVDEFFEI